MGQSDVGVKAPDFELPATTQEKIRLSTQLQQGPVLLLFYPLDWSPVCTNELCGLRDGLREYHSLGVQVLGISVDSIFSHKAFAEKLGIAFPLLSDFNKEVCRAYGAVHDEVLGLKGIAKRSAFLIDRQGIIRYRWVSEELGVLPDFKAIQAACAAL
jgi:peroxiredoxin